MVFEGRQCVDEVLLIRELPVWPIFLRTSLAVRKLACQWLLLQCVRPFEVLSKYVYLQLRFE